MSEKISFVSNIYEVADCLMPYMEQFLGHKERRHNWQRKEASNGNKAATVASLPLGTRVSCS